MSLKVFSSPKAFLYVTHCTQEFKSKNDYETCAVCIAAKNLLSTLLTGVTCSGSSETDRIVSQQSTTRQATSGIMRPERWKPAATDGPLLYPVPFRPPDRLACYVGGLATGVLITSRP